MKELEKAEKYLAELHSAILQLPEAEAIWDEVENLKESENCKIDLERDYAKWQKKFGKLPVDHYWEIFNAGNIEDKEPLVAMVSDDLADIYGDLKFGLLLYEKGLFPEAFWEWRFKFEIHWGNHLVGAQKAIRNYFSYKTEL